MRPDIPPEGLRREDDERRRGRGPQSAIGEQVTGQLGAQAAEEGLIMKRSGLVPYTRLALEATEYAKTQGKVDEYHEGLLKAYWEDNRNLGDLSVLRDVADKVGLNTEGLNLALRERSFEPAVLEQVDFAHELGISAIPAFIVGEYLFMGAQPYSFFKMVVERVIKEREEGAKSPLILPK